MTSEAVLRRISGPKSALAAGIALMLLGCFVFSLNDALQGAKQVIERRVNAFGVAMLNTWVREPTMDSMGRLSWITIVIFISSMIVPTSPQRMLAGTLVAASMDPLGVWFAHLRGMPVPSVVNTFVLFMPNYACAIVAVDGWPADLRTLDREELGQLCREIREYTVDAVHFGSPEMEALARGKILRMPVQ